MEESVKDLEAGLLYRLGKAGAAHCMDGESCNVEFIATQVINLLGKQNTRFQVFYKN